MGICALDDISPVFVEIAKALYGEAVDPRELWDVSKNMDSSDVHVNGAVKAKKPHSNAARALVLGAAAESAATYRAGQQAYGAMKAPKAVGETAGKLQAVKGLTGSRAAKIGEFGLQATNLGIGLIAARKLSVNAKKKATLNKAVFGWLRPVKQVMSDSQATRHTAALSRAAHKGDRIVAGAALTGTALVAHRTGVKRGRRQGLADQGYIGKAMLRPVNGVKAVNSGGLSTGLGRHGRLIGGKTPAPVLQPVARAMPKKIVDNSVMKAIGGRNARFVARNGQRALKTAKEDFGPVEAKAIAKERVAAPAKPAKTAGERRLSNLAAGSGAAHFHPRPFRRPNISKAELVWTGEIAKVDTDKRQVFGWCSLTRVNGQDVVDLQGDFVPLEEIEKSAYRYVIESRKGGDMHKRVSKFSIGDEPLHTADLIESFVVTPEKLEKMHLPPDALPLGWWVGMKVNSDEQWALVKADKRRSFSIHGTGARTEMVA